MPHHQSLTHKEKEWAYEQWCKGYTLVEVAAAMNVCSKTIQRAIHGRPRIKPILVYERPKEEETGGNYRPMFYHKEE